MLESTHWTTSIRKPQEHPDPLQSNEFYNLYHDLWRCFLMRSASNDFKWLYNRLLYLRDWLDGLIWNGSVLEFFIRFHSICIRVPLLSCR